MNSLYSDAPKMTKSMANVVNDLALSHRWVVYPGNQTYRLHSNISVIPLRDFDASWSYSMKTD